MGSAERHWSDMVSRRTVKRDIIGRLWRTPVSDSPSLALEAEQLITGDKDRLSCALSETVSQHLPMGTYSTLTPTVTKCLQMLPSTRQDEDTSLADQPWLGTADTVQSSGGSCCWERELCIILGIFQRQMRTVSGCRADWRDKEDFGGSQNARIHNYVHV